MTGLLEKKRCFEVLISKNDCNRQVQQFWITEERILWTNESKFEIFDQKSRTLPIAQAKNIITLYQR